jgi:hypothetical protein
MPIVFGDTSSLPPGTYIGRVPGGIDSERGLIDAVDTALELPEYFGQNWNALNECLEDLEWLPAGQVALVHEDLPLPNDPANLATYISVLTYAVDKWREDGNREFKVIFPREAESDVKVYIKEHYDDIKRRARLA